MKPTYIISESDLQAFQRTFPSRLKAIVSGRQTKVEPYGRTCGDGSENEKSERFSDPKSAPRCIALSVVVLISPPSSSAMTFSPCDREDNELRPHRSGRLRTSTIEVGDKEVTANEKASPTWTSRVR